MPAEEIEKWIEEANNGSVEQMMRLAKHFQALAKSGSDPIENGKSAVTWLIKASNNTNEEATVLLRQCLNDKLGECSFFKSFK